MSANDDENGDDQSGAGRREVAYRLFAAEYDDAELEHSESDEERAPNYVVTPTGARVNRLFAVGVLTEIEQVNEDVLRARIVDPTGAFVVYAGQYQPDEMAFLERTDPPAFLAVTGKARTFQPDDSDRVYTSVRPESINEVDAETRDRWAVQAAEQTLERVATMATALEQPERGDELAEHLRERGVDDGLAGGVALAIDHYGTTPEYLAAVRDLAIEAAEVVTGERDEASQIAVRPGDGDGSVDPAELTDLVDAVSEIETAGSAAASVGTAAADAEASSSDAEAESASTDGEAESASTEADAKPTSTDAAAATASVETSSGESTTDEPATEAETTAPDESDSAEAPTEPETSATADVDASADTEATAESKTEDDEGGDRLGDFEPGGIGEEDDESAASADAEADDASAETEDASVEMNGTTADADQTADTPVGGDDMYEFSEEEREEIEEEYGTEFSTGTEVAEPGEADIETPDPDEAVESDAEVTETDETVAEGEAVAEEAAEPVSEAETAAATEDAGAASGEVEPAEKPAGDAETADEPGDDAEAIDESAEPDEPNIPDDVSLTDVVVETMREMDDGDGVERGDLIDEVIADTGMTEPDVEDAIEEALMGGRCYEPTDDTLKPI
ncbi:hypothetical protein [Natronoarchaeum mannanilyticum]|uniref:Rpa-associated protein n=2 Tax=Natronoarchaeum mannanilyticum TaxID=926360 RepID=A0AAV3TBZ3_9EURY